jgi:hypothetical protein
MSAAPVHSGPTLAGKVSWFGGPNDLSAGGTPASGIPITHPGVAVYSRHTLGGWWRVTFANGRTVALQQTDIGPHPQTGRVLDVTYSALGLAGYTEHNFPTDSIIHAEYVGKRKPADANTPTTRRPAKANAPAAAAATGEPGGRGGMLITAALYVGLVTGGVFLATFGIHVLLGPRSPVHRVGAP